MAEPSDLTEWKPKRPGLSLLAKGLAGFNDYLQNDPVDVLPFGLTKPVAKGFASLIGLEPASKLLEKLAYGDNLTQGKGQTFSTAPDVFDGTLALAPPVAGLLKGMGKAASKVPLAKDSSPSALYGGPRYPAPLDPELFMSHGTTEQKLLGYHKQLPQELYHLSQAITRNKLSEFSGPDTWLIPQYGRFEPKLDQTVITATDSYSPRYSSALGSRVDEAAPMAKDYSRGWLTKEEYAEWQKNFVNGRLADQFGFPFQQGGLFQEGFSRDQIKSGGFSRLRNFGEGTDFPFKGGKPIKNAASINDSFNNRVMMSPRFQSLQHFEQSPYGGALLGEQSGHNRLSALENSTENLFNSLYQQHPYFADKAQSMGYTGNKIDKLRSIASGFADPFARSEKGRKFDSERALFNFDDLRVRNEAAKDYEDDATNFRNMTPDEIAQIRQTAGKILSGMKTAPSDYAEVKRYGQTKLNPDTFAGIITKSDSSELEQQALKRGLAFTRVSEYPTNSELTAAADELQKAGKKGTSIYMGGMARRNPGALPEQIPVNLQEIISKYANHPLDAENVYPSQLLAENSGLSEAQADSLYSWLKYTNYQKPGHPMSNVNWDGELQGAKVALDKAFPQAAPTEKDFGLPTTKPIGVFNHKWLDNSFTPTNLEAAGFDYLPDDAIAHLKTFAGQTGDVELNQLTKTYEESLQGNSMEDHDSAMKALLGVVEAIKGKKDSAPSAPLDPNFSWGGGAPLKKKMLTKDWSTATWEELNGVKISEEQAMPQTEWSAWNTAWQKAHEANKATKKTPAFFSGLASPIEQPVDFSKMTPFELSQVNTDALSHADMMKWLKASNGE